MAGAASMGLPRDEMESVAQEYAGYHNAGGGGRTVDLQSKDIEYGTWDVATRVFTPSNSPGNAVRVSGYEEWTLNADGLIAESKGHFDAEAYESQIRGDAEAPEADGL